MGEGVEEFRRRDGEKGSRKGEEKMSLEGERSLEGEEMERRSRRV